MKSSDMIEELKGAVTIAIGTFIITVAMCAGLIVGVYLFSLI